ncbi:hypothetical protein O6H91_10G083800 [Diphasiastrum complanatum]|uniref:Uncharacterized protein n=1 Tax=Diphasiastrum complanatum TaxID=34168 RepID=A0ACC2CIW4_DIPCM|nr:hypothetical protein O6H91_10G083800 [Diphasiastrum complanatum]
MAVDRVGTRNRAQAGKWRRHRLITGRGREGQMAKRRSGSWTSERTGEGRVARWSMAADQSSDQVSPADRERRKRGRERASAKQECGPLVGFRDEVSRSYGQTAGPG